MEQQTWTWHGCPPPLGVSGLQYCRLEGCGGQKMSDRKDGVACVLASEVRGGLVGCCRKKWVGSMG